MPSVNEVMDWLVKRISALTRTATDADLTDSEYMAVDNASAYTRKITVASLATWIHTKWAAFINALTPPKTSFASGDKIPVVNGSTATAMEASKLLSLTAQNALAGNTAPAFDPTRDEANKYLAGESVVYQGQTYVFKNDHYGDWNASDVETNSSLLLKSYQKHYYEQLVQDIVAKDGEGKQVNVNLFEQVIPIPASQNQWYNKNAVVKYNAYIHRTIVVSAADTRTLVFRVLSGKRYCISLPNGSFHRFIVAVSDKLPKPGGVLTETRNYTIGTSRSYIDFVMPEGYTYVAVYYYKSDLDVGVTDDEIKDLIVVNEGSTPLDYSNYEFSALAFDNMLYEKVESAYGSISSLQQLNQVLGAFVASETFEELARNGSFQEVNEITDIDFAETPNSYYTGSDTIRSSSNMNISEAIAVDRTKVFALVIRNSVPTAPYIVYFSDAEATHILCHEVFPSSKMRKGNLVVVNPPKDAVCYKVAWEKSVQARLFVIEYNYEYMSQRLLEQVRAFFKDSDVVIDEDLTNSLEYVEASPAGIIPDTGLITTNVSHGKVTTAMPIDRSAVYSVDANYNQYVAPICFYKDDAGLVFDSLAELPATSGNLTNFVLFFPPTAKSFRLCSYNESYLNLYKVHFEFGSGSQQEIQELTEDVEQLQMDVATLQSSAFLDETIDTINAVKYIPRKEIKLGADIFNLSDASYSPTHWSVSGDEISFTTTSATTDEFDTGIAIPSNGKYYAEVTISNYTRLEDLFYFKLGASGDKIDIYDGTATPSHSLVGNGGNLIIYTPFQNVSFTITIKLSPVVTGDVYDRSVTFDVKNVSCGNGDGSIIDAKWNVAIGPRENCFANNINATRCVAIGFNALRVLTSGWQNIAIGSFAMAQIARGDYNISIGSDNTYMFPNAFENVAIGRTCLFGLGAGQGQTAKRNVIIGCFAGKLATSEEVDSVYIGNRCAQSGIGSRCVFVGANVPGYSGGGVNRIGIGYNVDNNENNTAVIGNANIIKTKVYGNLIVEGTDHVKRKIVFNNDNTCSWEVVS